MNLNTKSEFLNPKQIQMFKIQNVLKAFCLEHLIFEFRYYLGFGA